MNRRSFITKALAGLAAVPVIGKLAHANNGDVMVAWNEPSPRKTYQETVLKDWPVLYIAGPVDRVETIWFDGKRVWDRSAGGPLSDDQARRLRY